MCLIRIIDDTSRIDEEPTTLCHASMLEQARLLSSISGSSLFGFTIGANNLLISCIADINRLRHEKQLGLETLCIKNAYHDLLMRLDQCRQTSIDAASNQSNCYNSKKNSISVYHSNAFIAATYIYLNQALLDGPPSYTAKYIEEVFYNIRAFFSLGNGNLSLWPAFIASTAAYEPADIEAAREWLKMASGVGIGNRIEIQTVIEEVWRLREVKSIQTGEDAGSIAIDWRYVIRDLGFDIPLI